jgi:heat shock protein HslJ
MRLRAAAVALLLVPALVSCGGKSESSGGGPQGGDGLVASWSLTSAAASSSKLSDFAITLIFSDTTASGFGGVNQYTTTFTSGPTGDLDFGDIASTRMAGSPAAMQAEQTYFAELETVTGYTVADGELELYAGEQEILTYSLSQ